MKSAARFSIVLVTTPDVKVARQLAEGALREKLIACANLIPRIESHYWWRGKIERDAETLILFKTTRAKLTALEKFILANHPYDTPEFIVLPINQGSQAYLDWISASVK